MKVLNILLCLSLIFFYFPLKVSFFIPEKTGFSHTFNGNKTRQFGHTGGWLYVRISHPRLLYEFDMQK